MNDPISGRRRFLRRTAKLALAGGVLAAGGWTLIDRGRSLYEVRLERTLMQTSVAVNVLTPDIEAAHRAIGLAFERMEAEVAILTRFGTESPVARLNRDGYLADAPASLRTVLHRALATSALTQGDFDITVAPVLDFYLGQSRPMTLTPADRQLVAARERLVGYRNIELSGSSVRLLQPAMSITLDGIAKGYVVDQGIASLRAAGIEYALIDAGGEVRAMAGADPDRHWTVGVVDPFDEGRIAASVRLRNAALSTSGNYEVFFTADRSLFHIINPHTGYSPDRYSSVTVMAEESVDSDAMSVAAFSMELPRLKDTLGACNQQWLVFSWDGSRRWRSRDLPLVSGRADVA